MLLQSGLIRVYQITNNFAGLGNDSTPPFPSASDAFKIYHANANYDSRDEGQYYYDFRYGDVSFFVMDTRRYRSGVEDGDSSRTMLGDKQLAALYDWLAKVCTEVAPHTVSSHVV
jgi:alkaline phosphatase D